MRCTNIINAKTGNTLYIYTWWVQQVHLSNKKSYSFLSPCHSIHSLLFLSLSTPLPFSHHHRPGEATTSRLPKAEEEGEARSSRRRRRRESTGSLPIVGGEEEGDRQQPRPHLPRRRQSRCYPLNVPSEGRKKVDQAPKGRNKVDPATPDRVTAEFDRRHRVAPRRVPHTDLCACTSTSPPCATRSTGSVPQLLCRQWDLPDPVPIRFAGDGIPPLSSSFSPAAGAARHHCWRPQVHPISLSTSHFPSLCSQHAPRR